MTYQNYPDKSGHYYLVYSKYGIKSQSIALWKYNETVNDAGHDMMYGNAIWIMYFSMRDHNKVCDFKKLSDIGLRYCLDFGKAIFFELNEEEFEKHVLIYEL